jgi:hypothetical protein
MALGFPRLGKAATLWSGIPLDSMIRLSPRTVIVTLFWAGGVLSGFLEGRAGRQQGRRQQGEGGFMG